MRNPSVLNRATSGSLATGLTVRTATSGFRAPGYFRQKSVCSGLQGIGLSKTTYTSGLRATGDPKSASMAALTTVSATPVSAFSAATGEVATTTTNARGPTWTSTSFTIPTTRQAPT